MNHWPHEPPKSFKSLVLSVKSAHNGLVIVSAENDAKTLALVFALDFREAKAHANIEASGFLSLDEGGNVDDAVVVLEYQKSVIGNGIIEITLPNGEKIECEVVIPVNIDIGTTFKAMDAQIAALRGQHTAAIAASSSERTPGD